MKSFSALFICMSAIAPGMNGCKKDGAVVCPKQAHLNTQFPDFPVEKGSRWTYVVYDSVNISHPRIDSLKIIVADGSILLHGQNARIFQLYYSQDTIKFVDTNYVCGNSDTIRIYNNRLLPEESYVFPLMIGAHWRGPLLADSFIVVSRELASSPAGSFPNCFFIERQIPYDVNYALSEKIWFTPKVGVIRKKIREFNFGPIRNQTWELVSFDFPGTGPVAKTD